MVLEDIQGKPVNAVDVFSLTIRALVNHFMDLVTKQGTGVKMHEVQWVLTIPAIWTDAAKQFMRKCAEKVINYASVDEPFFFFTVTVSFKMCFVVVIQFLINITFITIL